MATDDKRLDALRRNPRDVRSDELDAVLVGAGFRSRQRGTSHKVYSRGAVTLVIPQHRPYLKAVYVRQALQVLEEET